MSDFATWLNEKDTQAATSTASLANVAVRSSPDAPDKVAADLRTAHDFARETGLPVPPRSTVSSYRTDFERKIEEARNSTILSTAPKLSEWLVNADNAAIAKDDLGGLSWWENGLIVPRAIASAPSAMGEGFYGLAAAAAGLPGENAVSRFLSAQAIGSRAAKEAIAGPTGGWFGQQVQGAAQSIGLMAPGIAASIATGGAALPGVTAAYLVPGAMTQGGQSAQKALERGKPASQALYYGALDAAAEVLFERMPVGRLLGDIASGAGFGKIFARQLAIEVPSEVATTLYQNLNEYANLTPEKPLSQFLAEQPEAIRDTVVQTVLATAGVSIGAKGVQATLGKVADHIEKKVEADNAAARVAMFQELAGQAANSKTRTRLPEAFRSFVEAATKDGPVENLFVPAEKFAQYFQGLGLDPHEIAGRLEGVTAEDLDAALASGGDVMIPTASYATHLAGSEHDAFFIENMRLDPFEMSSAEAAEFNSRVIELRDAAFAEEEAARLADDERRTYEEELRDLLISRDRAAGRATDVARTEVEPIVAFYRTQAERSGMTLDEFMRRYPVMQIEGDRPEGMKFKSVDDLTMALAAARTAKQEAVKRGPSLLEWISDRGGIIDPGGELAARDAAVVARGRGRKTLRLARASAGDMASTGRKYGVDEVARAAVEAGYMADHPAVIEYRAAIERGDVTPDITGALWDAIDAELRGTPQQVANAAADDAAARNARLDEIEAYLNSIGVSLDNTDEEIRAAHEASRQYAQSAASLADVEAVAASAGVDLSVSEGSSTIILHKIVAGQRGEGAGTRVMEALAAYADRSGRRIVLTPSTDFGGSSIKRLAEFYKRFGFVQNKGRNRDFSVSEGMYREPSRSYTQSQAGPRDITSSPEFKAWFGDSKVVDEAGSPIVVYHGTNQSFESFSRKRIGKNTSAASSTEFFFTEDPREASEYASLAARTQVQDAVSVEKRSADLQKKIARAERAGNWDLAEKLQIELEDVEFGSINAEDAGHQIYPVYLSIKNPRVVNMGGRFDAHALAKEIKAAKKGGNDGLQVVGVYDPVSDRPEAFTTTQWVVFGPEQIKSVNNRGTFSPNDPRIMYQDGTAPRGMMQRGANGEMLVRYFAGADLSTLLHESGHVFLAIMQDMASRGEAHAVADLGVMREWWRGNASDVIKDARKAMPDVALATEDVAAYLDTGSTGDVMKDGAIDVGTQEQFARALEAYLMEGKAPSLSLRDVFERVAMWLTRIYKRLTSLDVTVSDEMRRVFDRMLATDEEIAAAEAKAGDVGVSATAAQLGMTEEEFARFKTLRSRAEADAKARVRSEAMRPIAREQEAKFKAERERVRAEVENQVKRMPVFRAMQELRFGKTFEGEDVGAIKLDRAATAREYGDGYVPLLPGATKDGKGHRNAVFANEGGMHPDVVADMYGFETGRDLLDALVRAPDMGEAIKAETDRLMREEHGDMLFDGTAEQIALDAVHGDRKGEWIAAELKAAVEVAGSDRGLTHKEARESARRSLRGVKVRDAIRSSRYLAAERKAANEAVTLSGMLARDRLWMDAAQRRVAAKAKAAMEGKSFDAVAAQIERANASTLRQNETAAKFIETKRRHLLNHMLYDESRKVAAAIEKVQDRIAKLDRSDKDLGKTIDIDHVKAARAIAARFGLASPDTAFDFDAWQQQLAFEDVVAHSALTTAIDAYRNAARHFKDLTVSELEAVSDAIDNLVSAGKRLKSLDIEGAKVDRRAAVDELVTILGARGSTANPALARKLKLSEKAKVGALSILSSLRRMEDWTRQMDDGEQGPFTRYLVRPVMDAVDRYRTDRAVRLKSLLDIINARKEGLFGRAINATELGYVFENKAEFLHAVLHTGNESNLEKLLIGRGWSQGYVDQQQAVTALGRPRVTRKGDPIMTRGQLDTSRWDAFMSRMINEGTFTAEDVATVNAVWKLMESTKRPAQAAHKRIFGFYFKEIESKGYDTSVGRLEGGYIPAIADTDASNDGQLRADQQAMEQNQASFMLPTTGSGFTKSRVQQYQTPLALNLMLLPAHLDKVLRFTHLEPVIRQTASIVNDRSFRDAINGMDKTIASSLIIPWLQRTAQQAVEAAPTSQAGRAAASVFRMLRKRVGLHTMMANVVNTAQQVSGLSSAMVLVKPSLVGHALTRFMKGDADAMRNEAFDASPFMAARIKDAARETQSRIQDAVTEPTVFGDIKLWIERHGYFMQTAFQNVVDVIVWHAAYDQSVGKGMDHGDAVFEADSVIRRSMSAMDPESVSMFETGSAFTRLFTMFYSYFNGQANLVGGEIAQAMRVGGWSGHRRMFFVYLFGVAIPAIIGEAIVEAAKGELGDEDDDGYLDDILELFIGSQLRYLAGMVPVAGSITTAMFNTFNGKPYDDRLSTSPVVSTVERAIKAPSSIYKAASGGDKSGAVVDSLTALGLITGLPLGWLAKPAGYATNVAEGDAKPSSPVDLVRGALSGRDGSEKKK